MNWNWQPEQGEEIEVRHMSLWTNGKIVSVEDGFYRVKIGKDIVKINRHDMSPKRISYKKVKDEE